MTRICAIGDSHLSALILGWKLIASEYSGVRFEFFGAPGLAMDDLEIGEASLTAGSAGLRRYLAMTDGKEEIRADADCYIVCGLGVRVLHVRPYGNFRSEAMAGRGRIPLSDSCFTECIQGRLNQTVASGTIRKLRRLSPAPITLVPQPHPGEPGSWSWLSRIERNREDAILAKFFDDACMGLAGNLGARVAFQPGFTKAGPLRTRRCYCRNSVMLNRNMDMEHPAGEASHMNGEYGAAVLRELLKGTGPARRHETDATETVETAI